jgi:uncharacterized alpha-E superfamily protein
MLSRVADSIYWMNRYIERAENTARFIAVNFILTLDTHDHSANQWMPLVMASGDQALFNEHYAEPSKQNVIRFLTFDTFNPNSLISCLTAARENARSVREIISSEMWEQVNRIYLYVRDAATSDASKSDMSKSDVSNKFEFFTQVKLEAHLFAGIMEGTMSHNEAWHFGRMGRLLERADKTSRILDVKYFILLPKIDDIGSPLDSAQWAAVLKSASGLEMYRKTHHLITPIEVAEFLILDRDFPRSILYAVSRAERSLHEITGNPKGEFTTSAEKALGRVRADVEYSDIQEIMTIGLHEYLDGLQVKLNAVGDRIFETFFALRPVVQTQMQSQTQA